MSEAAVETSNVKVRRVGKRMELRMSSHPSVLRPVRLALEEYGREAGLACEQADKIGLALNEALANVMRHGYGGAVDKPIMVSFDRNGEGAGEEVSVEIRDWAKPVDPAKLPQTVEHNEPLDVDAIKPGGLGLLCMRRLMDDVVFAPQPDGTLLIMKKRVNHVGH
jgi:anti-sigma regulatory factor (Ser/Thr protein kinase)